METKVVIFDLDGTLLDTLEDLSAAVNHALAQRSLPLHSLEEYRGMVGHGVRNLVRQALEKALSAAPAGKLVSAGRLVSGTPSETLVDAALADFKAYYTAHISDRTRPYPGMQALLSRLHARGVQLAIASNKFQAGTERLVAEFFPGIPFVAILGNREGYPLKPNPEIVREVLRQTGVSPSGAAMVGDSLTDMRTAAGGGIRGIAVSWGYRTLEASADYSLVTSVQELEGALLREETPRAIEVRGAQVP